MAVPNSSGPYTLCILDWCILDAVREMQTRLWAWLPNVTAEFERLAGLPRGATKPTAGIAQMCGLPPDVPNINQPMDGVAASMAVEESVSIADASRPRELKRRKLPHVE